MIQLRLYPSVACVCVLLLLSSAKSQGQQQTPGLSPALVDANAKQSLGLTPALVDANVKRGLTYTQNFTVVNNTNTKLRFHCSVSDYWYDEHNVRLSGRPGTLPRSASLWVQFSPEDVIVEARTSATIRAIISVPKDAAGGYYTIPFFEGEPAEKPIGQKAASNFGVRLGGLLMLATEGASEYNVEVKGSKVLPPTASSELELQLDIHNQGTAHVRLRGMFAILDSTGKLVGRGRNEEKTYLPGQHDIYRAPWGDTLAPGHYTAVVTLTYDRAGLEPATLVYELPFDLK
jgi:hypothetical protein